VERRERYTQQGERDIALQSSLELELDVEVESQLEAHRLSLGQSRQDSRLSEPGGWGEGLVVAPSPAPAAARGDGGADV